MNKNKLWKKATWIYNDWLMHYKGKSVNDITLSEHKKWSKEFQKWKKGNIEQGLDNVSTLEYNNHYE